MTNNAIVFCIYVYFIALSEQSEDLANVSVVSGFSNENPWQSKKWGKSFKLLLTFFKIYVKIK